MSTATAPSRPVTGPSTWLPGRRWECWSTDRDRSVFVTTTASDPTRARIMAEFKASVWLGCRCLDVVARYRSNVNVAMRKNLAMAIMRMQSPEWMITWRQHREVVLHMFCAFNAVTKKEARNTKSDALWQEEHEAFIHRAAAEGKMIPPHVLDQMTEGGRRKILHDYPDEHKWYVERCAERESRKNRAFQWHGAPGKKDIEARDAMAKVKL